MHNDSPAPVLLNLRSSRLRLFCVFLAVRAAPRFSLHDTASAFTFHDTQYSEDEVLLNPHVFPDARDGDVMEFYAKGAPSERRVALKVSARVIFFVWSGRKQRHFFSVL